MSNLEKKRIMYKTYNLNIKKKIQQAETKETEEWLKPRKQVTTYLTRIKACGTFEVRFRTEEQVKLTSTQVCKTNNGWLLFTLYMGKKKTL